jgi:hypothetical protein
MEASQELTAVQIIKELAAIHGTQVSVVIFTAVRALSVL